MRNYQNSISRIPVILVVVALAAYVPGFWWGVPHATAPDRKQSWGVDDETPLGPLAEIHNIMEPKPDRNLGYPLMFSFIVAAAYTPYLGYLWLTGQFSSVSATYPFGLSDPVMTLRMLTLIAHIVTVLMGVGIVVAAYETGQVLWDRRTGILAALFAMTSFPMFYYSRNANVDVPMLFFIALATVVFTRCLARGFNIGRAVWLGVFAGFSLGTKEAAFGWYVAMPVVLWFVQWRTSKTTSGWLTWSFWKASLAGFLAAVLAFGIGSGLFVEPGRYFAHVQFLTERLKLLSSGTAPVAATFPYTWEGSVQLANLMAGYLIDMMTLPGLLLALVGVGWALSREPKDAVFALMAVTYIGFMFLVLRSAQMRYLMPVPFALAFSSARAVMYARESRWQPVRVGFALLSCGIIGVGLLRGVALTYEMVNDSRYAAAALLEAQTKPGDRIEYFGPAQKIPPL